MPRKRISIVSINQNINYLALYEDYIKEKSCTSAKATIKGLKYKVLPFVNWLNANQYSNLSQSIVNEYILYLNNTHENKVTVNSLLRNIRTFCNWLYEHDYAPKVKIPIKKSYEVTKEVYTQEELKILLKKPTNTTKFNELRNWAIINFFIGTGCRINSLVNVKINDVNFVNDTITLRVTKNKKQQVIPLCSTLKNVLRQYLRTWTNTPTDYLFPNQYGEQLANVQVTHAINKYNKSRGISKTSCHLFRHTFSHNYLLQGGDIFRLQQILGHSTLDMVKIYANMNNIESLKQDYNKFNLLDTTSISKTRINLID